MNLLLQSLEKIKGFLITTRGSCDINLDFLILSNEGTARIN